MKTKNLLLCLCAASVTSLSQAQIQTAGTLFIEMNAASLSPGEVAGITNGGSLGGYFEAKGGGTTVPLATNVAGVGAILFDGSNDYLQLVASLGGALVPPPEGLVGAGATASIEVWVYNPAVATEETMIAWGRRGTAGANRAFSYGYSGQLGAASHHGAGASDLGWDDIGGAPLNNQWHHLVYTYDGTTTRVYADGVLLNAEAQPINTGANAGILLAAQWNSAGTAVGGQYGSLALVRVRVHDDALTPAQILNNYTVEKATFQAAAVAPTLLISGPTHRYSFNETAAADATGLLFHDSVGTAHGTVQGLSGTAPVASFSGSRLVLPGGPVATGAYGDLPNGLLSANSASKGGSGEVSIEVWFKVTNTRSWAHVFDFGSAGVLGATGQELTGPGGNSGLTMLDDFMFGAQVSGDVNRHRLEWGNRDPDPSGSTTNPISNVEITQTGVFNRDRHVVVTWKESTGQILAYENGIPVATLTASNSIGAINDLNNWLGRSQYGDNTMEGEIDEARLYNRVLSTGEARGNFQAGPDVVNTSATLAISKSPQNATVLQGSAAGFSVSAGGTPPLFYQWLRNGTPITGATDRTYQLAAASLSHHGDQYGCVVSNLNTSVTSGAATLTVTPNQAPPFQVLYERRDGNRDNYGGSTGALVGGMFKVGDADAMVTHLGYYDLNEDGLFMEHHVGVFSADGSALLGDVTVPQGTDPLLTNGYRWVALAKPLLLRANSSYLLGAEVFTSSGDGWPDNYAPLRWNPYFVGTSGFDTRGARYGSAAWPAAPLSPSAANGIYGAPNLAAIPSGPALVGLQQTTVTQYAGLSVTFAAAIGGQAPVRVQWYKAPATLLAGQTNSTLAFSSVSAGDAGEYYVTANNTLGSDQSSSVTLVVLADSPVQITQPPANATVPNGYPVTFSVTASGTPPISYQWRRNGTPIAGAIDRVFAIAAVSAANNGDLYSCVASNFANAMPNTNASGNALLTVLPNVAPPQHLLHTTWTGNRDDYSGMVGGIFQVGDADALVTHLAFFDYSDDGLASDHRVGIWPATGGTEPLGYVTVPAGTAAFLTNSYRWVALDKPIWLGKNTSYILAGESIAGLGDGWPDAGTTPIWDAYYVGANGSNTRDVRYGGGWPAAPTSGSGYGWGADRMYGVANLGIVPVGPPSVAVQETSVTRYATETATLSVIANGQAPLTVQWYKSPGTKLAGQTNTSLVLAGLALSDAGNYYVIASNAVSTTQSGNVTLNVLALTAPVITQQPQPQSVYQHQPATFSVSAIGQQPLSYQWKHNGAELAGATDSTFTVFDVTSSKVGNYSVTITNTLGATNSAGAALNLLAVPAGSYAEAILNANPLVYYRFSDVNDGTSAFNLGSLGVTHTGTSEGAYAGADGPRPPTFPVFEANNLAVGLDAMSTDVKIPPLNLSAVSSPNFTLAAWINKTGPQQSYAGIVFCRQSGAATGLGVKPDNAGGDMLTYHWNNVYYDFNSGLTVPDSQWTFVALVVEPNQATFYLHDGSVLQTATNVAEHLPVVFSDFSYVGWDPLGPTSRRFYGQIDEPMIFDRALGPAEIFGLYNAALVAPVRLEVTRSGGNLILKWSSGTLQYADEAAGPYSNLTGITSPHTVTPGELRKFYRVKVQ